jgi:hypothetical protein
VLASLIIAQQQAALRLASNGVISREKPSCIHPCRPQICTENF